MQAGAVCMLGGPSSPGRSSSSAIAITQDASGREMAQDPSEQDLSERCRRSGATAAMLQALIGIGAAQDGEQFRTQLQCLGGGIPVHFARR